MVSGDREALGRFAREHHVHYELEPEEVTGERRELVAVDVRLFAAHASSKLKTPACPECVDLLRELRSFAEQVVRSGDEASRTEVLPAASPALYQSTEDPGVDEVALTLRVRCDAPEHRRPEAGEERCLGEIRRRLDAVGVPRR
jgi:hypothetical protein